MHPRSKSNMTHPIGNPPILPTSSYQTLQQNTGNVGLKDKLNWRNEQRLRNAEMIMDMKKQNLGSTTDLAKDWYKDEMSSAQYHNNTMRSDARSPFKAKIPEEWESSPLNDRVHYNACPAVKHSQRKGDFSPDRYRTRTFNRKMKMVDSFTRILPGYDHQPSSCYTNAASHVLHP